MKDDLRVVLDTNVVVSALILPRSVPRQAFDAALHESRPLIAHETIVELDRVLRRPKLSRYVSEAGRLEFLAAYVAASEVVAIAHRITLSGDPDDNKFLDLAASGHADLIVSGDPDLLALNPFEFAGAADCDPDAARLSPYIHAAANPQLVVLTIRSSRKGAKHAKKRRIKRELGRCLAL